MSDRLASPKQQRLTSTHRARCVLSCPALCPALLRRCRCRASQTSARCSSARPSASCPRPTRPTATLTTPSGCWTPRASTCSRCRDSPFHAHQLVPCTVVTAAAASSSKMLFTPDTPSALLLARQMHPTSPVRRETFGRVAGCVLGMAQGLQPCTCFPCLETLCPGCYAKPRLGTPGSEPAALQQPISASSLSWQKEGWSSPGPGCALLQWLAPLRNGM